MAKGFKVKINFKGMQLSLTAWQKAADVELTKLIKDSARVWLNATVLSVIPVWSGASRASFLKLARAVSFPLSITGLKATPGQTRGALGPSIGFQQSTGKLVTDAKKGVYTFAYSTSLFHLVFNEFNNANQSPVAGRLYSRLKQPGPYNFQKLGKAAVEEFFASTIVDLPSPWDHVKLTSIRVG